MNPAGNCNRASCRPPVGAGGWAGLLVMAGALMVTTACGGGEADLGSAPETTITIPSTTTTASTTPPAPTTSIDFGPPENQGLAPLGEEATPDDVAALLDDIRGPSTDVATQVARLGPFLALQAPATARINDVSLTLSPDVDGGHRSTVEVRFWIPGDGDALLDQLDNELRSIGWFQAGGTEGVSDQGKPTTVAYFRDPGFDADERELEVSFEDGPGPTVVAYTYRVLATDEQVDRGDGITYFQRLSAWQEELPVPRTAELLDVGVESSEDSARLHATYRLSAEDEAEAVALAAAAVGTGPFELLGATPDDPPTSGPLRLVDETGRIVLLDFTRAIEAEQFEIVASTGVDLIPLG